MSKSPSRRSSASLLGALALTALAWPQAVHAQWGTSLALSTALYRAQETGCGSLFTGASEAPASLATPQFAKSSAILGGQMSALDRLKADQADSSSTSLGNGSAASLAAAERAVATLKPALNADPERFTQCATTGFAANIPGLKTLAPIQPALASGRAPGDFLASKRIRIGSTAFDQKWDRVRRSALTRSQASPALRSGGSGSDDLLGTINTWVNRNIAYVEDAELWGRADYWATARETLDRRKGDCEDLAIAKMQLLAAAGVPSNDMFLTVARDLARNADHAVLIVRQGNSYFMLDNSIDRVLEANSSHSYRPIVSFNNQSNWLHGF